MQRLFLLFLTWITMCASFDDTILPDSYPPRHPIYKLFKAEEGRKVNDATDYLASFLKYHHTADDSF